MIAPTASTPCGHTFCAFCVNNWQQKTKTCPRCNLELKETASFPRNFDLEGTIETYLATKDQSIRDDYEEAKKERNQEIQALKVKNEAPKEEPKVDQNLGNFEEFYN